MTRIMFASVPKVSQMRFLHNGVDVGPEEGIGDGGDRCTAAEAARANTLYGIGPKAKAGVSPQQIMYDFVAYRGFSISMTPQDPIWIADWIHAHSSTISVNILQNPSLQQLQACIQRGHMAILQVASYGLLKTFNGGDPYKWTPPKTPAGHVLSLSGYDENFQGVPTLIVNDPLRALSDQPYDYSWASFQQAHILRAFEIVGPSLLPAGNAGPSVVPTTPDFVQVNADTWKCSNGYLVIGAIYHQLVGMLAHPTAFKLWYGFPEENQHADPDGKIRQRFTNMIVQVEPDNSLCQLLPLLPYEAIQQLQAQVKALTAQLQPPPTSSVTKPLPPS